MHDVDLALIVRIALLIAGEIPEIALAANRAPLEPCDLVGVRGLRASRSSDQNDVVVDGVAIAAGHVTPHVRIEGKPPRLRLPSGGK